jgi:hypothetical protein
MRDRGLILGGLIVFLALVTFPFWYNTAARVSARPPELKLPPRQKECVAPVAFMKTSHMQFLIDWREGAVRNNVRAFTAYNGKRYDVSLTGTCLGCHAAGARAGQADFCGRCHDYAGVTPTCWNCHNDRPAEAGGSKQEAGGGKQ